MIQLYNEDCFDTMGRMESGKIHIILTSPFYNTNKKAGGTERFGTPVLRAVNTIMCGTTLTLTI